MSLCPDAPAPAPPEPAAAAALLVGARDLAAKDLVLLRSLLRLLDGVGGLRLVYAEPAEPCQVVFVPARWPQRLPPSCIVVRVVDLADDDPVGPGLQLHAPLRSANVGAVLRAAAVLVEPATPHGSGLAALFHLLARHLAAQDRRCTCLPLEDGRRLLLDFEARVLHGELPLAELLDGAYRLAPATRATPAERDAAAPLPSVALNELLWRAAARLGDDAVPASVPLAGRLRLARWPDAVALARPGLPRLAALLTSRPMSVEEACAATGLSPAAVHWFLQASLALGIARPAAPEPGVDIDLGRPAPPPGLPVAAAAPRSLLGRLRDRLKLW